MLSIAIVVIILLSFIVAYLYKQITKKHEPVYTVTHVDPVNFKIPFNEQLYQVSERVECSVWTGPTSETKIYYRAMGSNFTLWFNPSGEACGNDGIEVFYQKYKKAAEARDRAAVIESYEFNELIEKPRVPGSGIKVSG